MENHVDASLLTVFLTAVIIGCVLLPALVIFCVLLELPWINPAILMIISLLLSLKIGKNIERQRKAQLIRSKVEIRRKWVSLADYGASFGEIETMGSKMRGRKREEDKWSYMRRIFERSGTHERNKRGG